ncbi:MAG: hypothetical protein LUF04_03375, partial [Bacteroides sp.]|nr:hypothetical protein [Bacteroides sp.]
AQADASGQARARIYVLDVDGILIDHCGLSLFFDAEVRVQQPNDPVTYVYDYSCEEGVSDIFPISEGTVVTGVITIKLTPLSNEGYIIVQESDIVPGGTAILDVQVLLSLSASELEDKLGFPL